MIVASKRYTSCSIKLFVLDGYSPSASYVVMLCNPRSRHARDVASWGRIVQWIRSSNASVDESKFVNGNGDILLIDLVNFLRCNERLKS
jgi:hypothetical protein